jgi:hypothetical protein
VLPITAQELEVEYVIGYFFPVGILQLLRRRDKIAGLRAPGVLRKTETGATIERVFTTLKKPKATFNLDN